MPGMFILAIIAAVLAVLLAVAWRAVSHAAAKNPRNFDLQDGRRITKVATFALAGLTALFVLISAFNTVSTQNIGIETSFGKPVGHLSNGAHFTAPWDQVTEIDGAIQTDTWSGGNCVNIRVADQQTACANVRIRWRVLPSASDSLFRNYHTFENIRDSLVTSELQQALNQQFATYDPIASLTSTVRPGQPGNPTVTQLAGQVLGQMRSEIGSQIEVISVLVPNLTYDSTVQSRINAVLTQVADTDIAQQSEQTAADQAKANQTLANSVSNNQGVLEQNCLNILGQMVKQGMTPPAGFSCIPGSGSVGVIASGK